MRSPSRQAGATYLLMLFAVAALGLGLAGFGTVWSTAAQREQIGRASCRERVSSPV